MAELYLRLARLLVQPLSAPPVAAESDWAALVQLAREQGVGPLLARAIATLPPSDVPVRAREELAELYHRAAHASLRYEAIRARLCRRLSEKQIPVLLLKGAALAFTCYEDPTTRPMSDLDLLVEPSRVEEAIRCLEAEGLRPAGGSLEAERRSPRGHLVYVHAGTGTAVELHWELKLLGRAEAKATAEIWAGARPAACGDTARSMRHGHALPFLCAHMLLQHRDPRLLWLYDLHRLVLTLDAAEAMLVRDTASRWGLGPCTALALIRARHLFGTRLPEALEPWAAAVAGRSDLQSRVAAQALAPDTAEEPSEYLLSLLMNRNYSRLRVLVPSPDDVRERLGLGPHQPVGLAAYAAFLTRRVRNGPLHWRQFRQFWHGAPRRPSSHDFSVQRPNYPPPSK